MKHVTPSPIYHLIILSTHMVTIPLPQNLSRPPSGTNMNRSLSQRNQRLKPSVTTKSTTKLVARLTYNPNKDKQKATRKLRQKLMKNPVKINLPKPPPVTLVFASFNVNGLSLETSWAVGQLLKQRSYDVSLQTNL